LRKSEVIIIGPPEPVAEVIVKVELPKPPPKPAPPPIEAGIFILPLIAGLIGLVIKKKRS